MIKAILFDFDGVLTLDKTGSQSIVKYIAAKATIDSEHFKHMYYKYNKGLLHGEYTHKDIWANLCDDIGVDLDYSLLIEAFEHTEIDTDMLILAKELHTSYKLGMITDRIEIISKLYHFGEIFDVISVSDYYHSGKDSKLIFEKTIQSMQVEAENCVFIDNTAKNLRIPQEMGMKPILFDDENRNIHTFKTMLYGILEQLCESLY